MAEILIQLAGRAGAGVGSINLNTKWGVVQNRERVRHLDSWRYIHIILQGIAHNCRTSHIVKVQKDGYVRAM